MGAGRLTIEMRAAFVRRVLADVPAVDYESKIRDVALKVAIDRLPKPVAALLLNKEHAEYVARVHAWLGKEDSILPKSVSFMLPGLRNDDEQLEQAIREKTQELRKEWVKQEEIFASLRVKLSAVARSCNTLKQLQEAFPEFEQYMPKEEVMTKDLPACSSVVAELVKAGWPKGSKPPQKHKASVRVPA